MAALGYALQRFLLNRTLGDDLLPPLLVTFGLSVIIQNGLLEWFTADSRRLSAGTIEVATWRIADGLSIGVLPLIQFAAAVAVIGLLQLLFYRTALGRAFRATSDDQPVAQLMGLNDRTCRVAALSLAVIVCGRSACHPTNLIRRGPVSSWIRGQSSAGSVSLGHACRRRYSWCGAGNRRQADQDSEPSAILHSGGLAVRRKACFEIECVWIRVAFSRGERA